MTIFVFAFLMFLLRAGMVSGNSIEEMYSVVAYLHSEKEIPRTIDIDEETYQVWVKHRNESRPRPYFEPRYGTGFFVARGNSFFLVTAQHLAKDMTMYSTVTVNSKQDKPFKLSLQELWNRPEPIEWTFHPEADVAVLPLNPLREILKELHGHFLPFEMITSEGKPPLRNHLLMVIGFPLGLGTQNDFSPISQESRSASGFLTGKLQRAPFYLIDRPSVGGLSGAPVFVLPDLRNQFNSVNSRIRCVGLVHGTFSDSTGGKFGAVIPSAFIIQSIQEAEKKVPSFSDRNWMPESEESPTKK